MTPKSVVCFLLTVCILAWPLSALTAEKEIRVFQGAALSPFDREYDNSIRGPQKVDRAKLRLKLHGLVQRPQSLSYDQVLALGKVQRVVLMNCVEGWSELLLLTGVSLADVLAKAGAKKDARWVIFRAADGYSSAMPIEYLLKSKAMLAYQVNGRTLDARRGFPFWLVAEGKLGYKWVKWVVEIELSDKEYKGYWEKRGYSNSADVKRPAKRLVE